MIWRIAVLFLFRDRMGPTLHLLEIDEQRALSSGGAEIFLNDTIISSNNA